MTRKEIFDLIDPLYPCYAIGEHEGECTEPYVVLKFENQLSSMNNSQCGWQFVHVFLYAPLGDITILDEMLNKVQKLLNEKLEFTGDIAPELIDNEKKAYFRRLKYRIPKEVI
ncbi:hypothetical protein EXN65_18280 [Clostridium botulinum]|uniref:hypothetical protein n=1 Tax=Clostridium botulinum TaxID=1491 RepID=UPI0005858ACC|nr:hypothetical protein [Clostridium botulinum]AJE10953.1 hypothetical protein T259_2120 [Clostridium botulinum CDC_1436]AJE11557.1 hypothetical protein T259_1845 [Clostridium botulinum CDC_1436]NEZ85902.1 hypothetical protein [Clostridium botulinum]NFE32362.1 hypothetical protein [Clostridium botulinum]WCJ71971.1 hypothetical protein MHB86_002313 [Clostridium botulinum]